MKLAYILKIFSKVKHINRHYPKQTLCSLVFYNKINNMIDIKKLFLSRYLMLIYNVFMKKLSRFMIIFLCKIKKYIIL